MDAPGLVLFSILYLWQMPHFVAIAMFRQKEYAAAGLKSLATERGAAVCRTHILVYLFALLPVTFLPFALHMAGPLYLALAIALGAMFFGLGLWGYLKGSVIDWARRLFLTSLVYLTGLFIGLMIDGRPGH